MKKSKWIALAILGLALVPQLSVAETAKQSPTVRNDPHGPPPEAYTACEGKSAGDAARFVSPRGETVSGVCEEETGKLVLRPDHGQEGSGGRRQGPPPEAYSACEGKSSGDAGQFVGPRGDTVRGTCTELDGKMVLRPNRGVRQ